MSLIEVLDWSVETLLPAFFAKLDSFLIVEDVSLLGFSVAITVLVIVIGAVLLRA